MSGAVSVYFICFVCLAPVNHENRMVCHFAKCPLGYSLLRFVIDPENPPCTADMFDESYRQVINFKS